MPAETLSAKEAARELGTDARTFRKFMRATTPKEDQPGQGNRYAIPKTRIKKLKTAFDEWNKPKEKVVLADEDLDEELLDEDLLADELGDEDFEEDEDDVPDFSAADDGDDDEPSDAELEEIEGLDELDMDDVTEIEEL